MSEVIDVGPCQVQGAWVAGKVRVVWENGFLYVASSLHDVVRMVCPELPNKPKPGGWYRAETSIGVVEFRRRGCTCSYGVGRFAFAKLADAARDLESAETV